MRKSDFIFRYRVRNWREYNRALERRGSITFWVDEQAVRSWCSERVPGSRGRPQLYADTAIECSLVVKAVFHLSLRATQGFMESVVRLMGVGLPIPDYTTVCKRQCDLQVRLGAVPAGHPRHVVIDTTGLKVFGAGEWYVRKHGMGRGRRRTWRKLHLGVDEKTKDIVAVDLTTSAVHDSPHMPDVLDLVHDPVHQVSGDRAYDTGTCYQAILARGAVPTIPPRRNARLSTAKDPPPFRVERDAVIRRIKEDGPYPWRTSSGATRQSLAENAVSRFKALVGVKLTARIFENQQVEARVKCRRLLTLRHRPIPLTGGPVRDRPAGELQTSVRTNNSESYGTRDRRTCHVARRSVASGHRLVAQPATVGPAVLRVRLRTAIRMARSKQGVAPRLTQ